jgi:hypothetical protein
VLKVDCNVKITLGQRNWLLSRALRGERVKLVTIEQRVLVYYCHTGQTAPTLDRLRYLCIDGAVAADCASECIPHLAERWPDAE